MAVPAAAKPIKRVFAITTVEPGPFAFAGIWDSWKRPDGTRLETFALVTTRTQPLDLLHPYDAARMKMTPANPAVGNWRNNGPEMLDGPK